MQAVSTTQVEGAAMVVGARTVAVCLLAIFGLTATASAADVKQTLLWVQASEIPFPESHAEGMLLLRKYRGKPYNCLLLGVLQHALDLICLQPNPSSIFMSGQVGTCLWLKVSLPMHLAWPQAA